MTVRAFEDNLDLVRGWGEGGGEEGLHRRGRREGGGVVQEGVHMEGRWRGRHACGEEGYKGGCPGV